MSDMRNGQDTRYRRCITPSLAYIDPGAGSMIFQMLIVGALGSLYFLKTFWGRIRTFLTGLRGKGRGEDE